MAISKDQAKNVMREGEQGLDELWRHPDRSVPETEASFRGAFEASTSGFAISDLDGRVREVNQSLCDILGRSRDELLATSFFALAHPDDLPQQGPTAIPGDIDGFHVERRYSHANGKSVWADLSVSVVRGPNPSPGYYVFQAIDITGRREADQLRDRHAAELERSNAELEQFAYVASHDLQEPLRTVASYVDLLGQRYHERLDDRADRWIGYIAAGVERMQRLIQDLLTLARVRMEGAVFHPTDMGSVIATTWTDMQAFHPDVEATLTVGSLPTIDADEGQMNQLIQNLLDNAIKYRRLDVPLSIDVSALPLSSEPTAWQFSVRDNGRGLDMKYAERIFHIFERLHHNDEGTGIGLAICKRIVERHGGRIRVESTPGEGAAFIFTLGGQPHWQWSP